MSSDNKIYNNHVQNPNYARKKYLLVVIREEQ